MDVTFKQLYQLNNPKGYKTFAQEKNHLFVFNKKTFVFLHTLFPYFLFKFIFRACEYTFISANNIIYKKAFVEQTGKKMQSS